VNTIHVIASAASEDTPGVGTGHACQALDGCLQPEGFDSPILRTIRPTNMETREFEDEAFCVLTLGCARHSLKLLGKRA
jgi:hypothetical protein